ncbi:MAG: hypothetical protein JSR73_17890 [Proteobacteria bacterium]|nr:hypothetical protein [Pseudomonadota bacterium]
MPRPALPTARTGWLRAIAVLLACGATAAATAGPRADDLAVARRDYLDETRSLAPAAHAAAARYLTELAPRADALSPEEFLLAVFRIAAFADNGHDTENDHGGVWWPGARLPVRMIWFPDGWVVARADREYADLLGARVLRIDGHAPEDVFQRLREYWGGPDNSRRWNLEFIVEFAGLLHAAGIAQAPDRLTLELQLADGQPARRTLRFRPLAEVPAGQMVSRVWSPTPWPDEEDKGWRAFQPPVTPLYLGEGERSFRVASIPELRALYVAMRTHLDRPDERVEDFCRRVDAAVAAQHPRHLIVDLRFDTGGNIDLTRAWQRSLVARVPGRVYVLVSRHTFSAGIVAAAAFKHDARERARIVGEPVGDRLRFWSEGSDACLPDSRYCLHRTTGLWDLVRGCRGESGCYGDPYDAQVAGLDPDVPAPLSADAWLAGRDLAMEAVTRELTASDGKH